MVLKKKLKPIKTRTKRLLKTMLAGKSNHICKESTYRIMKSGLRVKGEKMIIDFQKQGIFSFCENRKIYS